MNLIKDGERFNLWKAVYTKDRVAKIARLGGFRHRQAHPVGWISFWLPEDKRPNFEARRV